LTGAPTETTKVTDPKFFSLLLKSDKKQFFALLTTNSTQTAALKQAKLLAGMSYCVLGCAETKDKQGNLVQLIKMRNAWTTGFWEGDWNDSGKGWTKQSRDAIDHQSKEADGSFVMSLQDVR